MTMNELTVWDLPFYVVIYILKFVFALCFYIASINSSFELGKSKYYKVDPLFAFMPN